RERQRRERLNDSAPRNTAADDRDTDHESGCGARVGENLGTGLRRRREGRLTARLKRTVERCHHGFAGWTSVHAFASAVASASASPSEASTSGRICSKGLRRYA